MSENTTQSTHELIRQHKAEAKVRMVRKVFAIAYDMGWHSLRSQEERALSKAQRCKKHINYFLLTNDHSPVHKAIDDLTGKELQIVITAFERMKEDVLRKVNRAAV